MMSKFLGLLLILPLFIWLYSWFLNYSLILDLITFGKGFAIILLAAIGVLISFNTSINSTTFT